MGKCDETAAITAAQITDFRIRHFTNAYYNLLSNMF